MDLGVLQEGRLRRSIREQQARRRRRRRLAGFGLVLILGGVIALLAFMSSEASGPTTVSRGHLDAGARPHHSGPAPRPQYGAALAAHARVRPRFKLALTSGLLFDVHTGRVLWERQPTERLPIASLTKMMTALVIVAHAKPGERVLITRAAIDFSGSGVGLLPLHKDVRLETLLYGLMLPSGNDAAIALAQHVAGTQRRFIAMMNARARSMGLRCTHFTTVSGIIDRGNYSCASDLAVIAHAVLEQPRLARIVATRDAVLPFPIKGGKLYLYNNNPLLRMRYPGTDGVKTGYTLAAGRCLVAAARRGHKWLAVVLLRSQDPPGQAQKLLGAGFATRGA
jgi:serine-type D-Ala-D-Ala carboxypeptidase (penicillin-binding protein 5/6)